MRRLLAAALLTAGASVLLPAAPASAQAGERITRYAVDIAVEPSGRLHVVETIEYDFGIVPRHGIFRTVPRRLRYDRDHDRLYPMSGVRVAASAGTPAQFKVEKGASLVVRVGDPKRTITGAHRYVLTYDVDDALNRFEDHDELYWNAIGAEWGVPVDRASVVVHADAPIDTVACFAGPKGSSLGCSSARAAGRTATFAQSRLSPYSGVTVVAALPLGYAAKVGPHLVEHRTLDKAFARSPRALGLSALLLLLGLGGVLRLLSGGRDRRFAGQVPGLEPPPGSAGTEEPVPLVGRGEIAVQFAPDQDMRPALMGVLLDERADALDVTATIVDLAVRGYLTIEELPRHGLFGRRDWKLTVLEQTASDDLRPWERTVLTGLFPGRNESLVSQLKVEFHPKLVEVQDALYADVVARGWFTRSPEAERGRWFTRGLVVTVLGGGLTYLLARFTHLGLAGLPVVLTGLLMLAVHRRLPFRTARGTAALDRALGFKTYLATAEANQLKFEEQEGIFARYLPYAVVLGETERWAKAFKNLDQQAAQNLYWYSGPHGWSSADFTDSMGAFSTSTSGTLAATPSSSGHSGFGGGSSGGGGGGGGGGSW